MLFSNVKRAFRFIVALIAALTAMLVFRALVLTIYTVEGSALSPLLHEGDRVLVNRWSYGLRVGGENSLFSYGRIGRQPVSVGDIVAFNNPDNTDEILIGRCKAVPGDTISHNGQTVVVPGRRDCADADYYWMETPGNNNADGTQLMLLISEQHIIGRVTNVVYSHDPKCQLWHGWRAERFLLPL